MRYLYVPLNRDALQKLVELAAKERRRPQDQAAHLLEQLLEEADVGNASSNYQVGSEVDRCA